MSDGYEVKGNAKSGKTSLIIDGKADRVSKTHQFYGKLHKPSMVKQNLRATAIHSEMKEKEIFRLQQKINAQGFVDYIDIWK